MTPGPVDLAIWLSIMPSLGKRLCWIVIAALVGLGVLLIARTPWDHPVTTALGPSAPTTVALERGTTRLAKALQFRTVSYQDRSLIDTDAFLSLHQYLEAAFPATHRTLTREIVNQYSLLYTWPGRNPELPPILLLGHLDVVPVEPETEARWTHPPFSGVISGGYVWGRGAMDMKVAVLGVLEATEMLLEDGFVPHRTIILAFGHDEEIGGEAGARQIAARLRLRGIRPALVLDEGLAIVDGAIPGIDTPIAFVGTSEKGYLNVELIAETEGGHSSMPPEKTAIGLLASAVDSLETHPMPHHLDGPARSMLEALAPTAPFFQRVALSNLWMFGGMITTLLEQKPATRALIRTTVAPTIMEAGVKENVLPSRARAVLNIRIHPSERLDDALAYVRRTVADARIRIRPMEGVRSEPSPISSSDSPVFLLLRRTIAQQFPDTHVVPGLVLGATDSRHYADLGDTIYRFMPIRLTMEDAARIHGTDERLSSENYREVIAFYAQLIRNSSDWRP